MNTKSTDSLMPVMSLRGLTKRFSGVIALNQIDLDLKAGEIHALAGENGAGKSSLIKLLCGIYQPDSGEMRFQGDIFAPKTPLIAMKAGIRVVHQELQMLNQLSVAENLLFEHLPRKQLGWVDRTALKTRAEFLLSLVGLSDISPFELVENLGMAQRQLIEIAKALANDSKLLILDEPTATLTPREANRLFEIIRKLREKNVAIVFVSHHLQELFEICDCVTVMRNGQKVATQTMNETTPNGLVELMVGRQLTSREHRISKSISSSSKPALRVENLSYKGQNRLQNQNHLNINSDINSDHSNHNLNNHQNNIESNLKNKENKENNLKDNAKNNQPKSISFSVDYGEILGIAGLVGSGRTETVRAIFGADRLVSGRIFRDEKEVIIHNPQDAIKNGICLVTENRKEEGLILDMPIDTNISMANLRTFINRQGFILRQKEQESAEKMVQQLDIRLKNTQQIPRELSGGNQQKVVLAKWFLKEPQVLILDEPTRGVDVGAKSEIHALLLQKAEQGMCVVVVSSDLSELIHLCGRIIVLSKGSIAGEMQRDQFDEKALLELAYQEYT